MLQLSFQSSPITIFVDLIGSTDNHGKLILKLDESIIITRQSMHCLIHYCWAHPGSSNLK